MNALVTLAMLALAAVAIALGIAMLLRSREDSAREKQMIDVLANIASNESQVRRQEIAIAPQFYGGRMGGQPSVNNGTHIPVDAEEIPVRG